MPPLRERTEDIPSLVIHFVREVAQRQGKVIEEIPEALIEALKRYPWPGNIRELQNVIERAVIAAVNGELQVPGIDEPGDASDAVHQNAGPG